jgi:hypothetical protein
MNKPMQDAVSRVHQIRFVKPPDSPNEPASACDPSELYEKALLNTLDANNKGQSAKCQAILDQREALELKRAELQFKRDNLQFLVDGMKACADASSDSVLDERTKLLFKDRISNLTLGNLTDASSTANAPITISSVGLEIGILLTTEDCKSIGRLLKKRYVEKYGKAPTEHGQICGGAVRMVCSYTNKDKIMMIEVIKEYQEDKVNPQKPAKQTKAAKPQKSTKRRKLMSCDNDQMTPFPWKK